MECRICGGKIIGDGNTIVFHCENVELDFVKFTRTRF